METKLLHMVLEAKRLFTVDYTRPVQVLIQDYGLTKDECMFWLKTLYTTKVEEYTPVVEKLFEKSK